VAGAQRILEIERQAKKGDIVFLCQSGGATALTALPVPGVSLADLQEVYRVLYFGCGANMPAANAVRNHIAMMNGKHARYVGDATLISLHTEEIPPDLRVHLFPNFFAGYTGIDPYDAAIGVLNGYRCWDRVPQSVRDFLSARDPQYGPIRPEEVKGKPHYWFRVMGPEYMVEAARQKAEDLGLNAAVLISSLSDVEAQPVAHTLGFLSQEVEVLGRPFTPPCALICGGELVVTVGNETGIGGRNQEFALAAALRIDGSKNVVIGSADSDGMDGPTPVAGAIIDGESISRARAAGFDVEAELARHNAHPVLEAIGETIVTGTRTTNVRDLRVVYVGARSF
jgi:glycerate 2-kinase